MNFTKLMGTLKPKVVVPLVNGEFPQTGPLAKLLWEQESNDADAVSARLRKSNLPGIKVQQCPAVGHPLDITL